MAVVVGVTVNAVGRGSPTREGMKVYLPHFLVDLANGMTDTK
jgi:hypothetical protein